MMKRLLSCALSFLFLLLLTSCTDDWMPYENTEYDINQKVKGNIFLISEIESELLELAAEYDNDAKLTFVQYKFESETSGTAEFQFFREYEKNGKYYSVLITLFANIDDSIIYKVCYEEGISKRVTGYRNAIIRNDEDAYDIYTSYLNNTDLEERNDLLYSTVLFYDDNVVVCNYDENNDLISRSEL